MLEQYRCARCNKYTTKNSFAFLSANKRSSTCLACWYASKPKTIVVIYTVTTVVTPKLTKRHIHIPKQRLRKSNMISQTLRNTQRLPLEHGYVYVVYSAKLALYKIGMTINTKQRFYALQRKYGVLVLICLIESADMRNLEVDLHRQYSNCYQYGEWFNLTDGDISAIKQLIMT